MTGECNAVTGTCAEAFAEAYALDVEASPGDAFAGFAAANQLQRASNPYDFQQDAAAHEALRSAFAHRLPLRCDGTISDAPIFVIGLPRTGVNIVAQTLLAHRDIAAFRDDDAMMQAVMHLAGTPTPPLSDTEVLKGLEGKSAQALGELYLSAQGKLAGRGARVVDASPLNFLAIGWIVEALPNASIVFLRRGTMDSLWSNYAHYHDPGGPLYGWANDPMDTARYIVSYQRLMAFWRQRFPGRLHEVAYELFLQDREVQTRRMLAHCGLAWDPACVGSLEEPSGDGPAGRWRAYEAYLGEPMAFFSANGIPFD